MSKAKLQARLLAKCNKLTQPTFGTTGCWMWTGRCNVGGYGTLWVHPDTQRELGADPVLTHGTMLVHRAAYLAFTGVIPPGSKVGLACEAPGCFNPDHLWLIPKASAPHKRSRRAGEGRSKRRIVTPDATEVLECGHAAFCRLESGRCYACLLEALGAGDTMERPIDAGRPELVDPYDPTGEWGGPPRRFVEKGMTLEGAVLGGVTGHGAGGIR